MQKLICFSVNLLQIENQTRYGKGVCVLLKVFLNIFTAVDLQKKALNCYKVGVANQWVFASDFPNICTEISHSYFLSCYS